MASGNARARATLRYHPSQYTPWALHTWGEKQLRQEYTRLRDIAVKRTKRIKKEPGIRDEPDIKYWEKKMPKLSEMVDRLEIEDALADLAIFITNPEISTVGGIKSRREKQRRAWKEAVGDDEEPPDAMTLREWWQYIKSRGISDLYPSDEIVAYYYSVKGKRSRLTEEGFRQWMESKAYWADQSNAGPEPDSGSDSL